MFKNLLKISFQDLTGEKGYTLISILGLKTGLTCGLFLLLYVADELTAHSHHNNAASIYRVVVHVKKTDGPYKQSPVWMPPIETLTGNYSVVQNAAPSRSDLEVYKQEERSPCEEGAYADSTAFDMFTIFLSPATVKPRWINRTALY